MDNKGTLLSIWERVFPDVEELAPHGRQKKRHLLLMDSHSLHTFNYQFLKLMNDNKIVVLAFPAHTTHVMQPLDDVPFAQLKMAWYEAMWLHVRSVCAKKLSKGDFFKIFVPCWKKAIAVWNI